MLDSGQQKRFDKTWEMKGHLKCFFNSKTGQN